MMARTRGASLCDGLQKLARDEDMWLGELASVGAVETAEHLALECAPEVCVILKIIESVDVCPNKIILLAVFDMCDLIGADKGSRICIVADTTSLQFSEHCLIFVMEVEGAEVVGVLDEPAAHELLDNSLIAVFAG
jgi:hypothetical protein